MDSIGCLAIGSGLSGWSGVLILVYILSSRLSLCDAERVSLCWPHGVVVVTAHTDLSQVQQTEPSSRGLNTRIGNVCIALFPPGEGVVVVEEVSDPFIAHPMDETRAIPLATAIAQWETCIGSRTLDHLFSEENPVAVPRKPQISMLGSSGVHRCPLSVGGSGYNRASPRRWDKR